VAFRETRESNLGTPGRRSWLQIFSKRQPLGAAQKVRGIGTVDLNRGFDRNIKGVSTEIKQEQWMETKTRDLEEEYFARKEFERKRKIEEEKQSNLKQEEREKRKELHYMKCPKCGMELVEIDYKGVKIDECSECSGVWLDAGELEQVSNMNKSGMDKFFSIFRSP
jgi:uncharacterized protein